MKTGLRVAMVCLALALWAPPWAQADYLIYKLGGGRAFVLQGTVTISSDRQVTYTHPTLKTTLTFRYDRNRIEVIKAESPKVLLNRRLAAAKRDADKMYEAAVWGLKHGLIQEFYRAVDEVLKVNPEHQLAKQVVELKEKMDAPLSEESAQKAEKVLRDFCKKSDMKVARSKHYVILYDTSDKPPPGQRKPRHLQRLDLLEQVYETFLLTFWSRNIKLEIPNEYLPIVLFSEYQDYLAFSVNYSPDLAGAAGYWIHSNNIGVFYDNTSYDTLKAVKDLAQEMKREGEAIKAQAGAIAAREVIKYAETLTLVISVVQENLDIEVVSHEGTHQMAGNTGLFPRHVQVPSWAHEGLATYFESPGELGWGGVGAVNEQRLEFYRGLEPDRVHSNIDFIVADNIFKFAASHGAALHAYGQAWALTHFLMEKHPEKMVSYYRRLGELPPDIILSGELLVSLFNEVFGTDRGTLDLEWRAHMRSLKPDLERIREESERGGG